MLKRNFKKCFIMLLASIITLVSTLPAMPVFAADTVTIDCASVIRGVTHCASGSLYGITETIPADVNSLVAPLKPYVMRNPARGGSGNQHPFGSAIAVSARLSGIPSAKVSVDLADMLPYWPYKFPGMSSWLSQVKSFIDDKKASGRSNYYGYEIWNEPDGTWNKDNGTFEDMWIQTYKLIRENDPSAKIIGPCYSYYNRNTVSSFLTYCKNNNCMPDIMSWHELSGIQNVSNNLKNYRSVESSLGISALPVSINEYCDADHNLEGQPGSAACFIGKFERYKVDSACISWWFVPKPGRLGSLLATDTQKGAGWYLFKWYGDMTGNMVSVNPPNEASSSIDGCACVDSSAKYISCILGGSNSGTVSTTIKNIPSFIGSTASVKVEKVDWISKDTVCNGTTEVSSKNYTVSNGQITVTMTGCNNSSGYRIYITPASGSSILPGDTNGDGKLTSVDLAYIKRYILQIITSFPSGDINSGDMNGDGNINYIDYDLVKKALVGSESPSTGSGIVSGNTYTLTNVKSGLALDNYNSTADGYKVGQWAYNDGATQKWKITSVGNGYYTLTNQMSGKNLDNGNTATNGTNVLQWTANNINTQSWKIVNVEGDVYMLQNQMSGLNLDNGDSTSAGQTVLQWTPNGNSTQLWEIK